MSGERAEAFRYRQQVFGLSNPARRHYRGLRRQGFTRTEARLMVIGACVTFPAKFYDDEAALRSKEWSVKVIDRRVSGLSDGA